MAHHLIVWMDSKHAKVFELLPKKESEEHDLKVHEHHDHHHTSDEHKHASEKFYAELANSLKNATEIILLGPGIGKDAFLKYLQTHHQQEIAQKVIHTETVDHPSNAQIIAFGRQYFKTHGIKI